jgi:N utilization substance protein B
MGKRSTARRLAMQIIFQVELTGINDLDFAFEQTKENESFMPETVDFARGLVEGVLEKKEELDRIIKEKSIGWSLDRITTVDKSILRIGIYEMKYLKTPCSVAINEAVNLAKKFSTEDSSKFVNGILGKLVKEEQLDMSTAVVEEE